MLYTTYETITNGYNMEFLYLLSIISILLGISVIITKNPVISVLFLIGLFISISLYLMMIGLYFIGLSYLLVYVGAISILFLFILMLINVRVSELTTEGNNSAILSIITILSFSFSINKILPYSMYINYNYFNFNNIFYIDNILNLAGSNTSVPITYTTNNNIINDIWQDNIGIISNKNWDNTLIEVSHISGIGNLLYTNLFIYLIITSLILLLAMVGCIVITIKKTKNN